MFKQFSQKHASSSRGPLLMGKNSLQVTSWWLSLAQGQRYLSLNYDLVPNIMVVEFNSSSCVSCQPSLYFYVVDCIKKRDMKIESTFYHRFTSKEAPVSVPTITLSSYDVRYIMGLDMCALGHTAVKKCSSKLAHEKIDHVVPQETTGYHSAGRKVYCFIFFKVAASGNEMDKIYNSFNSVIWMLSLL